MSSQKIDTLPPEVESAIGKRLVCYDRKPRRVEEITSSFRYPWFYIINESDPDSNMGHYITAYSLIVQLRGHDAPAPELDEAFIERMKHRRVVPMGGDALESWMKGEILKKSRLEVEKE